MPGISRYLVVLLQSSHCFPNSFFRISSVRWIPSLVWPPTCPQPSSEQRQFRLSTIDIVSFAPKTADIVNKESSTLLRYYRTELPQLEPTRWQTAVANPKPVPWRPTNRALRVAHQLEVELPDSFLDAKIVLETTTGDICRMDGETNALWSVLSRFGLDSGVLAAV